MKFDYICEKYGISKELLVLLCKNEIAGTKQDNVYVFCDNDICVISEALFLQGAGLCDKYIISYFKSDNCGKECILRCVRRRLLDDIHSQQKMLDKIDHVIYKLHSCECCECKEE